VLINGFVNQFKNGRDVVQLPHLNQIFERNFPTLLDNKLLSLVPNWFQFDSSPISLSSECNFTPNVSIAAARFRKPLISFTLGLLNPNVWVRSGSQEQLDDAAK